MHYQNIYPQPLSFKFLQKFDAGDNLSIVVADTFRGNAILTQLNRNVIITRLGD